MFFRLAFQPGLETAGAGVDDQDGEVGLAGAGDHVGDKVSVAWGIEDGECGLVGFELVHADVDCDALAPFVGALVEYPCQCK